MHAIQASGNCIRNVTSDAFAGVAADEWIDPRVVSELLRSGLCCILNLRFSPQV